MLFFFVSSDSTYRDLSKNDFFKILLNISGLRHFFGSIFFDKSSLSGNLPRPTKISSHSLPIPIVFRVLKNPQWSQ